MTACRVIWTRWYWNEKTGERLRNVEVLALAVAVGALARYVVGVDEVVPARRLDGAHRFVGDFYGGRDGADQLHQGRLTGLIIEGHSPPCTYARRRGRGQ